MEKFLILWLLALCVACTFSLSGRDIDKTSKNDKTQEEGKNKDDRSGTSSFTFMGVGDNLIHAAIWYEYRLQGTPQEQYNFDYIYQLTNTYSQNADLAYINAETICAGNVMELSHYPVFNGPTQILDAVANAGFDWMSICSNHTLDAGEYGLMYEMEYLRDTYPKFSYTGSHLSEEEANTPKVVEINGIKVGLQSYTYGLNGYALPEDKPWLVNLIDKDKIKKDMDKLNEASDVQIVTMHWGEEYNTNTTAEQKELANFLNECGVDVIIGGHPHVIGTGEMIHGANQDTLCYYSLGNFLSAQDTPERMVGGMASFKLNYNFETKEVSFEEVKFTPTVTYFDGNWCNFRTTTIHEYTDDLAASHNMPETTRAFVQQYTEEVFGHPEGFELVLE